MPDTWMQSLSAYRYPVDLRDFGDGKKYPGWFNFNSGVGDRESTMEFEAHFRRHAAQALEPWLEVVYWKMYSQPAWRDRITRQRADHFSEHDVKPGFLFSVCKHLYMAKPTREHFEFIQAALGIIGGGIAVAATFPAFLRPDLFPMVDRRVAKWVGHCMAKHNDADPSGPQLMRPRFLDTNQGALTMRDFEFMESWISWCRHVAQKLTYRTLIEWRARDVDMAVFHAWGGRGDTNPKIHLNPLSAHNDN